MSACGVEGGADRTLTIGKHKGKSFSQIWSEDRPYCQWVASLASPSGVLKDFADFIRGTTTSSAARPLHSSQLPPGESSSDTSASLDAFAFPASADFPPLVASGPKAPFNAKAASSTPTLPPPNQRATAQASCPKPPSTAPWTPRKNGSASVSAIAQETGPRPDRVRLECAAVAFELVDPTSFKVVSLDTRFGRKVFSSFLPRPLYDRLMRLGAQQHSSEQRGNFLALNAEKYKEVLDTIQKEFSTELNSIPDFVLRAFDAFRVHAPPAKLHRKCAAVLTGIQTPRTVSRSRDVLMLIGAELQAGLRPFQIAGVEFGLRRNGRCIIGDEMGLGKTLQALAVAAVYNSEWPVLVVCPSSIIFQWRDQAKRWLSHLLSDPDEQVFVVKSGKKTVPTTAKIVLVSYDLFAKNAHLQTLYNVVICDESHYLKNLSAKRTQAIVPIIQKARRAMLLSGTPALNKPSELFQQLVALLPDFARYDEFAKRYCEVKHNPWSKRTEYAGSKHAEELFQLLTKTVMIRRLKKDVQTELPPKLRSKVPIECSEKDLREIRSKMAELDGSGGGQMFGSSCFDDSDGDGACQTTLQVSSDGDQNSDNANKPEQTNARNLISELFVLTGNAKIRGVCDYVSYLLQLECKFIVFAHHKKMLDALEAQVMKEKVQYIRVDGATPLPKRETFIKSFQESDEYKVAVLSITACGHGLNLTASGTVVFAELYWVPGQMIQAEDRCHRMGSTFSSIQVHYLIAEGTVDDMVWKTLNKKWSAVTSSLNGRTETLEASQRSRVEAASAAMSPSRVDRSQTRITSFIAKPPLKGQSTLLDFARVCGPTRPRAGTDVAATTMKVDPLSPLDGAGDLSALDEVDDVDLGATELGVQLPERRHGRTERAAAAAGVSGGKGDFKLSSASYSGSQIVQSISARDEQQMDRRAQSSNASCEQHVLSSQGRKRAKVVDLDLFGTPTPPPAGDLSDPATTSLDDMCSSLSCDSRVLDVRPTKRIHTGASVPHDNGSAAA